MMLLHVGGIVVMTGESPTTSDCGYGHSILFHYQMFIIQSHESRCEYKVVDCDNKSCRVKKPRREMVRHVQEECQYRMVSCPGCKTTCTFRLMEEHTSECPKCPVSCPNDCGNTMKREEVESHLIDECPLTIVPCSYQNIGCSFEVQRKDLNDHTTNHVEQHLAIAVEKIVSLGKQMDDNEKKATLTNQCIQKQMDDNENKATLTNQRNLKQMDEMCKRFQIQMDELKKVATLTNQRIQKQMDDNEKSATLTNERNQKQMDEMCKRFQIQMDEMKKAATLTNQHIQKQMDDNEKSATLTNQRNLKQMDEMKKQIQEIKDEINPIVHVMTNNGKGCFSYIWEIKNVGDELLEKSSDSFYTHKNGYKLQLGWSNRFKVLWLNIMPGEYDNILTWPLQIREVKFTLLSQSSQQNNFERNAKLNITSVSQGVVKINYIGYVIATSDILQFQELQKFVVNDTVFLTLEIEIESISVKA